MGNSMNKGANVWHFWCPSFIWNPHLFMALGEDANSGVGSMHVCNWDTKNVTNWNHMHSSSMAGYVPTLSFVRDVSWAWKASSFCDFRNWPDAIFLLLDTRKSLIFQTCLIRNTIAYLCLNMIHFDAVDFRKCRSELLKKWYDFFDEQCR